MAEDQNIGLQIMPFHAIQQKSYKTRNILIIIWIIIRLHVRISLWSKKRENLMDFYDIWVPKHHMMMMMINNWPGR